MYCDVRQWHHMLQELQLSVSFDGRPVSYGFGALDTLVPAYPASIH